jgi:hypothetical protein
MKEVRTIALQVQALPRSIGGDQDARRLVICVGIEGRLHLFALVVAHRAVESEDASVSVGTCFDSTLENLREVALRVGVLGEHDQALGSPSGAAGGRPPRAP